MLREYLVGIGFKVDDQQFKKFKAGMESISKSAKVVGETLATTSTIVAASVTSMASQFEKLYYQSQRTKASVANIQALEFGAEQVGVSADQAASALEGLTTALRTNPGMKGYLHALGVKEAKDSTETLFNLIARLKQMGAPGTAGYAVASQIAGQFGIDEKTLFHMEQGLDQMRAAYNERKRLAATYGTDADKLAAQSRQFMNLLRQLEARLMGVGMVVERDLLPWGIKLLTWVNNAIDKFGAWDTKLHQLHPTLGKLVSLAIALGSALGGIAVSKGLLSLLGVAGRGILSIGEGAAAEGAGAAAAGAGAAAEGGGLLALAGASLPVIIAAAVGAAIVWMTLHPDKVRKAVSTAWNWTKQEAKNLPGQVANVAHKTAQVTKNVAHNIAGDVHAVGGVKNYLGIVADTIAPGATTAMKKVAAAIKGTIADFIASNEGFSDKRYADHKGQSIGYGHLIKPGENIGQRIDKPTALNLLAGDIQTAMNAVKSAVKVNLNDNQLKALTDFAFNVGTKAFQGSTLLKKLNNSDFAGAAAEFGKWDKVKTANGYVVDKGLQARRQADAELFKTAPQLHQETNIYVTGTDKPQATGREVIDQQRRVNGDLVRNFVGATQ